MVLLYNVRYIYIYNLATRDHVLTARSAAKRVVARAARLEMFGLRPGKRERQREMHAGPGRTLPPSYTLSSFYRFYMVSCHLRCVQPGQRGMGVRPAF